MAEMKIDFIKEVKDITECSICTEVYSEPKVLPCIHTFCLKCLEGWGKDKQPGDKLSCPICRKNCSIPSGGFQDLPNNFFISKLLSLQMVGRSTQIKPETLCEVCSDMKDEKEIATMWCMNCEQNLCTFCGNCHTKVKSSRSHTVVDVSMVRSMDQSSILRSTVTFCTIHPNDPLRLYCLDCKATICMMCFVEVHQSHKCSSVENAAQKFIQSLEADVNQMTEYISKIREMEKQVLKEKFDFSDQISQLRISIIRSGEDLKSSINSQVESLLLELKSIQNRKLKEIEIAIEEVQRHLVMLESFLRYCEEVKSKGTHSDITRVSDDLHIRAKELQELYISQNDFCPIEVAFKAVNWRDFLSKERSNFLGDIKMCNKEFVYVVGMKTQMCVRFTSVDLQDATSWMYSGKSDAISFVTNKDIQIIAISLYGGRSHAHHDINIKIYNTSSSAPCAPSTTDSNADYAVPVLTFDDGVDSDGRVVPYPIHLPMAVTIKANSKCTVVSKMRGPITYYGTDGLGTVSCSDNVTFKFKHHEESRNNTGVHRGQIPVIIFRVV